VGVAREAKRARQRRHVGKSRGRIEREATAQHGIDGRRDRRVGATRRRTGMHAREPLVGFASALAERVHAVERLPQRHAERELIGSGSDGFARELLGCHVSRRTQERARSRGGVVRCTIVLVRVGVLRDVDEPEVGDQRARSFVDEHVVRLEVPVDEPAVVDRGQARSRAEPYIHDLRPGAGLQLRPRA
jgi:hypothetical protein